jgi:hypothetical protein
VTLVRTPQSHDGIDSLRSRLAELDAALSRRAAEIAAAKSGLEAPFSGVPDRRLGAAATARFSPE